MRHGRSASAAAEAATATARRVLRSTGWRLTTLAQRLEHQNLDQEQPTPQADLGGERDVEWAWCLAHLRHEPGRVLDFGTGNGILALTASLAGHDVVAVDLEPEQFLFTGAALEYRQGDFNRMDFEPASFDQIVNCSSIEHVGLPGRYCSPDEPDGDLRAMRRMASLLRPEGDMILAVSLGRDAVFSPWHRVYGHARLPRLLEPFEIEKESYWAKLDLRRWEPVDRERALAEAGSDRYYAIGLYVLSSR